MEIVYTTKEGTEILVSKGSKSENDFIVKYQEKGKHIRTPKHIHLVVDIFAKKTGNLDLTNKMIDYILGVIRSVQPATTPVPNLQHFQESHAEPFEELNQFGEYSVEFLLVTTELIMIQEKTNYPSGTLNLRLFQKLRDGSDIFSIVSAATFR